MGWHMGGPMFVAVLFVLGAVAAFASPHAGQTSAPPLAVSAPAGTPSAAAVPTAPAAGAPAPSPTSVPVPRVVYDGPMFAHRPAAWGASDIPPGAPVPNTPTGESTAQFLRSLSNNGTYQPHYVGGACYGRWPAGGQSSYSDGCYGHDEPAVNPYSDLPGSGGNVTWNVTLPVDRSPSHNQSQIYTAIWFGMNLYDPYGYNAQCFLELQMYPDAAPSGAPQAGVWSGFAVGWQIQLSNGFEDPCYAAPLKQASNGAPYRMTQGDHLNVTMTGWVRSPYGENITINDTTSGAVSNLNLYNTGLHYPLDPAYLANDLEDSLPWSPGGDLPVSFAFESGHTADAPGNNSYGGCSSGVPPANALDPAVPCGSYDPWNWSSNTKSPWEIFPTTFFNSHSRVKASQYGFEQDFGGIYWIDPLSNGACAGADGSAFCSYPWYSFDAKLGAFEFGATDYTGTTQDFGQYDQYPGYLLVDSSGLVFYPVRNFTYTAPSGSSLALTVHGHGTVYFLNRAVRAGATFSSLPSGAYSVNAVPDPGESFLGYSSTGGVRLDAAATGWSSLQVGANGTLSATFGPTAPTPANVTISDTGGHGSVTVVGGFAFPIERSFANVPGTFGTFDFPEAPINVANGATVQLAPGIYSLAALPNPGYRFTGWSGTTGLYLFTPESNYTWVNVTGAPGSVTAHYAATGQTTQLWLTSDPSRGGRVDFNGVSYPSGTVLTVPVGSYPIAPVPAPSYTFTAWGTGPMATLTDYASATTVELQHGSTYVTAVFSSTPVIRVAAGAHGDVELAGTLASGPTPLTQYGDQTYSLVAAPHTGYVFSSWNVTPASHLAVDHPTSPVATLTVSGSGTVTPVFLPAPATSSVRFVNPGGTVWFNAVDRYVGNGTNSTLARTTYVLAETPAAGLEFAGWSTNLNVTVLTKYVFSPHGEYVAEYELKVHGASGLVTASFVPLVHPVTFVDFPANSSTTVTITLGSSSFTVPAGTTILLADGHYTLRLNGAVPKGLQWFVTSNLTVGKAGQPTTPLTVAGSGTIYLVGGHTGPSQGSPPPARAGAPGATDPAAPSPVGSGVGVPTKPRA